jgi:hypothetical protein
MEELQAFVEELNKKKASFILYPDGKIYKHENGHIKLVENIFCNFLDNGK